MGQDYRGSQGAEEGTRGPQGGRRLPAPDRRGREAAGRVGPRLQAQARGHEYFKRDEKRRRPGHRRLPQRHTID